MNIFFNSRKLFKVNIFYLIFNKFFIYVTIELKKKFNFNIPHFYLFKNFNKKKCSNCNSKKKNQFLSKCIPDYNINLIPSKFQKKIYLRSIAECGNCGLIQDFNQMNINELKKFISNYGSKDDYMREEAWHTFPIPKEVKNEYFNLFWKKRFSQWNKQLNFSNAKKILFLRPTLGFVIDYLKKKNNSEYYFIEISDMSKREIIKKHNDVKELDGNITYILYGDFLKYKNYFDLIISHHTFVHVFNISDGIKKCKSLLKKNGKFIFTDEILFKPWNPFHYNYWTEEVFTKILKKHFSKVNVLNDAGFDKPTHIKNYTLKGDSPDFICIK